MLDRIAEIASDGESRVGQRGEDIPMHGADPATTVPAMPDARRDQFASDIHGGVVASSTPYAVARKRKRGSLLHGDNLTSFAAPHIDPALPDVRLGQAASVTHRTCAEAALITDPGDAGRESGHRRQVTQKPKAALATVPPQGGAGEGQRGAVLHGGSATPAKIRRVKARRGVSSQTCVDIQQRHAADAIQVPALPDGGVDLKARETHPLVVDPATIPEIAGDGEGLADQGWTDTHSEVVSEATPIGGNAEDAIGHAAHETHWRPADRVTNSQIGGDAEGRVGQWFGDTHRPTADAAAEIRSDAEGGVDHPLEGSQSACVDPVTISEIREQWRRRQAWHRAEKSLTLQAKALCRRLAADGDKVEADVIYRAAMGEGSHPMADIALAAVFPLTEARDGVERHRKAVESRLRKLAKRLPVAPWVESVPGASLNSLAAVVGEAGDVGAFPYTNPAKLWKRMGLAVMPDGTRQRRVGGEEGVEHGYSPARRSVVWNIGGSLIGGMGRGPRLEPGQDIDAVEGLSDLQRVFVRRIRYEAERDPAHARPMTKAGKESFSKHAAARAKRYVEIRFLRDLWREWRRAIGAASTIEEASAAT